MKIRTKTNEDICKSNNLTTPIFTNILDEKTTKQKIRATLEILEKTLCGTLGPYGSTTIIQDKAGHHIITKDGYDLCNRIWFEDEASRTVLDIVRNVASNQVLTVGDGSTSAIVVASELYQKLTSDEALELFRHISAKDITNIIKMLGDILEKELPKLAVPVSKDFHEIKTIAKIATNNDSDTGEFIYNIYKDIGQFGFITTDVVKKVAKDEYVRQEGIEWKRGPVDPCFLQTFKDKKIDIENSKVFISNANFTINDCEFLAQVIGDVCGTAGDNLVIIGNNFNEDVLNFFRNNRLKHLRIQKTPELNFTVVDIDQVTKTSRNTLEDLSLLLGCQIYDKFKSTPEEYYMDQSKFIGTANRVIITEKTTQIISDDSQLTEEKSSLKKDKVKEFEDRLSELQDVENPTQEQDFEIFELRKRISELTNTTAVINVGGDTLTERMSRERLIEDAIYACKSAINNGYITGGNISIPRLIHKFKDEISDQILEKFSYLNEDIIVSILNIVENSFLESYKNVLNNSDLPDDEIESIINRCLNEQVFYNLKLHRYENNNETEVINSLETDLEILHSTLSIISILAVSNQFITLNLNMKN